MRNWNTFFLFFFFFYKYSFEPTYEELKQTTTRKILPRASCFEPTYEELKQNIFIVSLDKFILFWAYLWGIETDPGSRQNLATY